MANNARLISGGVYVNNPIVYEVKNDALSATDKPTFHRVKVEVHCALSTDTAWTTLTSNKPISDSTKANAVTVDISSALRSVADSMEYAYNTTTVPTVKYWLKAYDEYMIDGELHTESGVTTVGSAESPVTVYLGGFTDMERLKGEATNSNSKCSLKPTSGCEIVGCGEVMVIPNSRTGVKTVTAPNTQGFVAGANAYCVPVTKDRYMFRFVNSRGLVESCSCCCMAKVGQDIKMEEYARSTQELIDKFSRKTTKKTVNTPVLTLNTGPLTLDWLRWWEQEFLQSNQHWMKYNGVWVNVNIKADESLTTIDRTKGEVLCFDFEAALDINGGY